MPDKTIITPIGGPSPARKAPRSLPSKRSLSRDIDYLVYFIAAFLALSAFVLSAYFFYGFTETDRGFWTLFSACGLCFGVGSLAYIPLAITAYIARSSSKGRVTRKAAAFALLLMLPWVCVSIVFVGWSALPKPYAFFALALSTILSVWAFSRLRSLPRA